MAKISKFKKQTIFDLFAIKEYQDFIKEWLELYDKYMANNPHPPYKVQKDCLYALMSGMIQKVYDFCQDQHDYEELSMFLTKWVSDNVNITIKHIEDCRRQDEEDA